jgi:hypothetical protein
MEPHNPREETKSHKQDRNDHGCVIERGSLFTERIATLVANWPKILECADGVLSRGMIGSVAASRKQCGDKHDDESTHANQSPQALSPVVVQMIPQKSKAGQMREATKPC